MLIPVPPPGKRIYRVQFRFWLDVMRAEEHDLAIYVEKLKKSRIFIRTVRDSLRLIRDLREGRVEVLEKLFPFVKLYYTKEVVSAFTDEERLARIEQLLIEQNGSYETLPAFEAIRKALPTPAAFSADDLEITQASSSEDDKPTWNFMISSNLSIYGHCDYLPAEIRAYAIRTGRIAPDKRAKEAAPPQGDGSAKAMDVPQFEAPSFDENELELPL